MTRTLLLFSLFFGGVQAVIAQQILTVDQAIATALKNNYDIRISRNDSLSYSIDESYIYTAFLPQLNGTASKNFTRNQDSLAYRSTSRKDTAGLSTSNSLNFGVRLDWVLFDGMRMFATRDRIRELVKLGDLQVKAQLNNTISQVLVTYFNIVQQKQQLNAIIEQKSISEERVKLADRKLMVGLGAKPELLQAKVDLNAFTSTQYRQNTVIAQLKEQLNQLMGIQSGVTYDVVDSIPINESLTLDEVYKNIDNSNPELQLAKKNIEISHIGLREIRAGYYPTVSLNSSYNFAQVNNTKNLNPFALPYRQSGGLVYGLTANIPIFNGFTVNRQLKQARLNIFQQQLQLDNQRLMMDVAVKNAFRDYELQKQNLVLEEENILLAKENVTIALERFRLGVSTYIELREAQISLNDGYNRLIAARYNAKVAEVELMRLKGEILK
ncbi:TolC family protein [Flavihumibacter sediminis]|nr:TolC family protein [Flavihumibacter sediminis]